jgi:hypothetical protein
MRFIAVCAVVVATLGSDTGRLVAQAWKLPEPSISFHDLVARDREHTKSLDLVGSSFAGRVLTAIGGAAIGAGVGYFASQVVRGDWDEQPDRSIDRPAWAAVGGSLGFALGFSFPVTGLAPAAAAPGLQRSRLIITAEEIEELTVQTAHDVVRLLRPEWLNDRGRHTFGESADETIQVYQDGVRLGGMSWLDQVQADHVRSLRYLDAAQATMRWGAGNSHGAILIVTGVRTGTGDEGRSNGAGQPQR